MSVRSQSLYGSLVYQELPVGRGSPSRRGMMGIWNEWECWHSYCLCKRTGLGSARIGKTLESLVE